MKKVRLLVIFSAIIAVFLPSMLLAEDLNDLAYESRIHLSAGTIWNPEGDGDCLLFPYYDVRKVGDKNQVNTISIENVGAYGIAAKLRFKDWSRGREIFSKDIWVPSMATWSATIELSEDGTNAIITGPGNVLWRNDSKTFYFTNSLLNGVPFTARNIRKGLGESTLYGFVEVIGEEKTSPEETGGKVARLAQSERDCPNTLRGTLSISRIEEGTTLSYDAVAIGNFSRGQGSLFRKPGSPYPRLDNGEDSLDQLEFQLSKWEIFGPFSVDPSNQGKTSLIVTFPTKAFHYSGGRRLDELNNPFEAQMENKRESLAVSLSSQDIPLSPDFETSLPYAVNVIGLYPDSNSPTGTDNLALSTYSSFSGDVKLSSDGMAERILIQDYEYFKEIFSTYKGLPAMGLILREYRNPDVLHTVATPVEFSAVWGESSAESILFPTFINGPSPGQINTAYSYTTGGASSTLGHPIEYEIDWGDGTTSGWLGAGVTSATKTWTAGGSYYLRSRARCAIHTDLVSKWSREFIVTIEISEVVSLPSVPVGPAIGLPNTLYSYTTGGAVSNLGHPVQYIFYWGDDTDSNWLPMGVTSAQKAWSKGGTYQVKVKARCVTHPSVVSSETVLPVNIELISEPNTPTGTDQGNLGDTFSYMTGGASSNINDPIEYQMDWAGDGSDLSAWQSSTTFAKTWTKGGNYTVRARARCAIHTTIISDWSGGLTVTVNNPAPTLASISPTSGNRLQTLNVTFTGTNFLSGVSTVNFGAGITVNSTTVTSGTSLTANITIGPAAATGPRDVSVINAGPGGGTATLTNGFTVNNPAPTITSISPTNKTVGDPGFPLTVNGTNFTSDSVVRLDGYDLITTFVSSTQLTAAISAIDLETAGTFSITVVNPAPGGGTSNGQMFVVTNPAPTLASVLPTSGNRLQTLDVTLTGTKFVDGVSSVSFGSNITVNSTTVNSSTSITVNITIRATAATGARNVSVTNGSPGGGTATLTGAFTVNNPAPTLTSVSPNSGNLLQTLSVIFTGTNFISGVSSVDFGSDITVNSTTVNSSTRITANITIAGTAATGPRDVSVTNDTPGGGTATLTDGFTVN